MYYGLNSSFDEGKYKEMKDFNEVHNKSPEHQAPPRKYDKDRLNRLATAKHGSRNQFYQASTNDSVTANPPKRREMSAQPRQISSTLTNGTVSAKKGGDTVELEQDSTLNQDGGTLGSTINAGQGWKQRPRTPPKVAMIQKKNNAEIEKVIRTKSKYDHTEDMGEYLRKKGHKEK